MARNCAYYILSSVFCLKRGRAVQRQAEVIPLACCVASSVVGFQLPRKQQRCFSKQQKQRAAENGFSEGNAGSVGVFSGDHVLLWVQPVDHFKLCKHEKGSFERIQREVSSFLRRNKGRQKT